MGRWRARGEAPRGELVLGCVWLGITQGRGDMVPSGALRGWPLWPMASDATAAFVCAQSPSFLRLCHCARRLLARMLAVPGVD
jgi:hypothetical protein